MRWYPIVTFWQVSADMSHASGVPGGHGHNYGDSVLDGWVSDTPGLSVYFPRRSQSQPKLRALIDALREIAAAVSR